MNKSRLVGVGLVTLAVLGGVAIASNRPKGVRTPCPYSSPTTFTIPMVVTASPNSTITFPAYQRVCPGDTVIWTLENKCKDCGNGKVKIKIDDRIRRHATSCSPPPNIAEGKDPFKKKANKTCKPEHPTGVLFGHRETLGDCTVRPDAENGCYKYWLKGTFDIDPEVEVQGGIRIEASPSPQATPSPQVSPVP